MELIKGFQKRDKRSVGTAQVIIGPTNAELIDISEGGLCFQTDENHHAHISNIKNITVQFEKDKDLPWDVELVMSAKICRNTWNEQKNCYLVGVQIHKIKGEGKEDLKNLVAHLGESDSNWELDLEL